MKQSMTRPSVMNWSYPEGWIYESIHGLIVSAVELYKTFSIQHSSLIRFAIWLSLDHKSLEFYKEMGVTKSGFIFIAVS